MMAYACMYTILVMITHYPKNEFMEYTRSFHNSTNRLREKLSDLMFILFRFVSNEICLTV